jgi:hypothetical protein
MYYFLMSNIQVMHVVHKVDGSLPEFGGSTFNTASKVAKIKMQLLVS